jgi:sialate O-acetylesterase
MPVPGINRRAKNMPANSTTWFFMKSKIPLPLLLKFLLFGAVMSASAQSDLPFLHPLFSDHMVLQRGVKVPVWGWTHPGSKVTVRFGDQTKTAIAEPDGKWMIHLDRLKESDQPRILAVTGTDGTQPVTVQDVLVGDVWLCSGQSNMEMGIGACNATNDIASANFPQIRLLTVPRRVAGSPVASVECRWLPCSPSNVMQGLWGGFSAAGFFFGRELNQQLHIPIGLIHSSWGGTLAEAWTSAEGLQPLGDFDQQLEKEASSDKRPKADFDSDYEAWAQKNDPGTMQGWEKAAQSTDGWKTVQMPQPFEKAGLPDYDGIVWFRRTFELPADWSGRPVKLGLGPIDDIDTTFVNGKKVGQMNRYDLNRVYTIPASVLKPGENVIAVRVLDTGGTGGMTGTAEQQFLKPAHGDGATVSLSGEWQMRDSVPFSKLPAPPTVQDANNPNVVTVLYNGMIAPLLPFAIKGAIWYQGESNAGRAAQYRRLLPAMIADWRHRFGVGDFPFYIVQLAAFQQTHAEPRENEWAELREAQAITAQSISHSGLAVAIDIGEANDIHPKNKAEVGRRLALSALAKTYGKKIEFSGPWFSSMKVDGDAVRLSFDHVDGGLIAKGGDLKGFSVAGEDRKFVWGTARIEGKQVVVSTPGINKPVAVRYAWDENPVCNLFNQSGLPAVPFRTDDWPGITTDKK